VIGGADSAREITEWFTDTPQSGFKVTGVWSPRESERRAWLDVRNGYVPVFDSARSLSDAVELSDAQAVMVTDSEHLGHRGLRELTWYLDGRDIDLVVSPNVFTLPTARLSLHEASGMPLLHVQPPQYAGATRFTKSLFDRLGAALLLLAFAPLMVVVAILVKATSPGPVFFRQERVGIGGVPFAMMKFRSMRTGADAELAALLASEGKSLTELPKLTRDPRLTRVGAFLRRFSIDELPQLFNVVRGDMSLVGPRPQRDFEVEQYDHVAHRRLRVRPGMTGLWQVSGRSDLGYEEAIELDVHYVENWSMISDLIILWRTVRAVLGSDGAY